MNGENRAALGARQKLAEIEAQLKASPPRPSVDLRREVIKMTLDGAPVAQIATKCQIAPEEVRKIVKAFNSFLKDDIYF
jgi:hypothetical protein